MKLAATLVLVASFVLAGCGGGEKSGETKPAGTGTAAATATAKPAAAPAGTGGW